jgi:hypothetical protein
MERTNSWVEKSDVLNVGEEDNDNWKSEKM